MRGRLGLVAFVALLAASAPPAAGSLRQAEEQEEIPLAARVPRMDNPLAQLVYARGIKRRLGERSGDDRAFWRQLAVEAYQAVRAFHPEAHELGAEGAFRAGELLRAGGASAAAIDEFQAARELGKGTDFRARAGLEIAHIHRREERARRALDLYLQVAADGAARPRYRDDAWLWAGRIWLDQGRVEDARRAWRGVAESGEDPLDRLQAYDDLALSWVDQGDLEAAAGVLDQCLRALSDVALEETRLGERVRNGLLRMRVVDVLKHEIRERQASRRGRRTPRKP